MWHRAPLIGSMPVPSYPSKDIKSHAHSPRRRTGVRPAADNVFAMRNAVSNHMQNSFGHFSPYLNGHTSSYNGFFDDFDRSKPTLNWTENIESNVDNAHHQFSTGVAKPRCQRQTNTDTSMPDYECSNPEGSVSMSTGDDFTTASFQIDEINLGSHHAPNNTPISVQQNSWEFGTNPIVNIHISYTNHNIRPAISGILRRHCDTCGFSQFIDRFASEPVIWTSKTDSSAASPSC